jgi:hypothetical protein
MNASEIRTDKQIVRVKNTKSAAGFTSARPSRSFLKAKSLTKPLLNNKKKSELLSK